MHPLVKVGIVRWRPELGSVIVKVVSCGLSVVKTQQASTSKGRPSNMLYAGDQSM